MIMISNYQDLKAKVLEKLAKAIDDNNYGQAKDIATTLAQIELAEKYSAFWPYYYTFTASNYPPLPPSYPPNIVFYPPFDTDLHSDNTSLQGPP
jgi:hypothetical protein